MLYKYVMFSENELEEYAKMFCNIGIKDVEEQMKILDFFYKLGVINHSFNK